MTLCIAAAADLDGEPVTILSHEWRVENELYGSETMDKTAFIAPGVYGLMAGNPQRAQELAGLYRTHFLKEPLDGNKPFMPLFKRPFYAHRRQMIDEYLTETLGVSRKWFYENGKQKLTETAYHEKLAEIRQINSEASLILCSFVEMLGSKRRVICVADENRRRSPYQSAVCIEQNFVATGSGATNAEASLHRREHDQHVPLRRALYHVREAMYYGGFTPGVGRDMTIVVLRSDGNIYTTTEKAEGMMEEALERYGPKEIENGAEWYDNSGLISKQAN